MNQDELRTRLAIVDLFGALSKRGLKQLARAGKIVAHPDGAEVIAEGAGAVGFHLIVEGTARVTTGTVVRRTLGVGDYFGEISVLDGKPRSASVEAVDSLQTFIVNPHVVKTLLAENPAFAQGLLVLLCARLREAEKPSG